MARFATLFVLLLVGALANPAGAVEYTSRHLAEQCTSDESLSAVTASRVGFCMGFILGVVDTYKVWRRYVDRRYEPVSDTGFCIPDDIDIHQMRAVFVDWLQRHRDRIDDTPYATVVAAFVEAYPCTEADWL